MLCASITYIFASHSVDCEWKPYVKRESPCSNTCGSGSFRWTREKKVNESNRGSCSNSLASGVEECYECNEIGVTI